MQKTFVSILLLGSAVAAFAQGTVSFSNGAFNKVSIGVFGGPAPTWTVVPTTPGLINYGLFYGFGATQPATLTFLSTTLGVNSTSTAGLIASAVDGVSPLNVVQIPGTNPGDTDVWLQVKGWTASFGTDWVAAQEASATYPNFWAFFGETAVINVSDGGLGPTTGPGAIIWQTAAGTDPHKFPGGLTVFPPIPEPSTMALFGLGVAALLIFRRGNYRFKQQTYRLICKRQS